MPRDFLDGTSLPDEVYADLDFDAVVGEIGTAAGDNSFRGFFQGDDETGLFFYGEDAEAMFAAVERILRRLPIGQNARWFCVMANRRSARVKCASPGTETASRAARLDGARTTKLAAPAWELDDGERLHREAPSFSDPRSDESAGIAASGVYSARSCRDGSRQLSVHGR